jgi:hypothetical protein
LGYLPSAQRPARTAANFTPLSVAAYAESQPYGDDFVFTFGVRYDQVDPGMASRGAA